MPSRNVSISLPLEMLQQAEEVAKQEHRSLSELFREAFRVYRLQRLQAISEGRKEQEVARISQQIRAELHPEISNEESER